MPFVNIKITKEGATAEQKADLIEGATRLLQEILGMLSLLAKAFQNCGSTTDRVTAFITRGKANL